MAWKFIDTIAKIAHFRAVEPADADDLSFFIKRARAIQEMGYDVGFAFMPRYPDGPPFYVCQGRYKKEAGIATGFDAFSRADCFAKTLYELVERAVWKEQSVFWSEESVLASLESIGDQHTDILNLAGFSDAQRRTLSHLAFTEKTVFRWSKGVRLDDGSAEYIPSQLVSAKYAADPGTREPILRVSNSNGIACGASFEDAAYRGLLELVERDSFMITFHNAISAPRIDPSSISSSKPRAILGLLAKYGIECDLVLLPTDAPATVVCSVLRDPSGIGPSLAVGARAHHDPELAVLGALTESYGVWYLARFMGIYRTKLPEGRLGLLQRIAFWGKSENAPQLDWLTSGDRRALPDGAKNARDARSLAAALRKAGVDSAAIAMSPPLLRNMGIHAACVVSAQLQPLYLDSEPRYLGGRRLKSVPQKLGYAASEAPPPYPHPFP